MTQTSKASVRIGVAGVGSLGQHHARLYAGMANVELVGVYDKDARRAAEIAAQHKTRSFDDLDELASRVEALSVAVPTDKHFEVFSHLAARGRHMLVEKPIAATVDEAERMVRMARERGLILQIGHIERFNPVTRYLGEHLDQPRFIEAARLAPYPPPRQGLSPRGTEVSVVLDLMIHDLDILLHFVRSDVAEIHAVGTPVLSGSEDIANVRLKFANGCVANVTASRVSRERLRKIRVYQKDSYLSLDFMNQTGRRHRRAGSQIEVEDLPIVKGEPLALELASFVEAVQLGRPPAVTGQEAAEALKLAIEVCRQIAENPS